MWRNAHRVKCFLLGLKIKQNHQGNTNYLFRDFVFCRALCRIFRIEIKLDKWFSQQSNIQLSAQLSVWALLRTKLSLFVLQISITWQTDLKSTIHIQFSSHHHWIALIYIFYVYRCGMPTISNKHKYQFWLLYVRDCERVKCGKHSRNAKTLKRNGISC